MLRVLVLDDEELVRKLVAWLLSRNAPVVAVPSASNVEALALLTTRIPFHLIWQDMNRAEGNGLNFLNALRALPRELQHGGIRLRHLPVVIGSGALRDSCSSPILQRRYPDVLCTHKPISVQKAVLLAYMGLHHLCVRVGEDLEAAGHPHFPPPDSPPPDDDPWIETELLYGPRSHIWQHQAIRWAALDAWDTFLRRWLP